MKGKDGNFVFIDLNAVIYVAGLSRVNMCIGNLVGSYKNTHMCM